MSRSKKNFLPILKTQVISVWCFCILQLYWNCWLVLMAMLVESFGFSIHKIISSENKFSLPDLDAFSSCLVTPTMTSSILLNSSGERGHPCFVSRSYRKSLQLSTMDDYSCGFVVYGLHCVAVCSFVSSLGAFIMKGGCILSNAFLHLLRSVYVVFLL